MSAYRLAHAMQFFRIFWFVPKLLNFDQKTRRMTIAQEMLNDVNDDPDLLKKVITGNESWVYGYDVETKAQSSQWKHTESPRPKKHVKFD